VSNHVRFRFTAVTVLRHGQLTGESVGRGRPIQTLAGENGDRESAGINRHVVGDERALQERRSDSILTSSLAPAAAR